MKTQKIVESLGASLDRYTQLEQWFDGLNLMRETDRNAMVELKAAQIDLLHDIAYWSSALLESEHNSNKG